MAELAGRQLAAMVQANDKLLKALTVLLALKDEHLLDELRTVFAAIVSDSPEMRAGTNETWAHLRHELTLITALVKDADDEGLDGHDGVRPS